MVPPDSRRVREALNKCVQDLGAHGLHEMAVEADAPGFNEVGVARSPRHGHEEHSAVSWVAPHPRRELHAIHDGHREVAQHGIRPTTRKLLETVKPIGRHHDLRPERLQLALEDLAVIVVILDDQDPGGRRATEDIGNPILHLLTTSPRG